MLKIGEVSIPNQVVLAPMAGVCNSAFRLIAKEFGCGLVCAEMVSDKAILHGNKRTLEMLYVDERERPLSLQIFGGDKAALLEAVKFVDRNTNADIIDLNMGCPVPKVTKTNAGSKWLLDPNKIYEMVSYATSVAQKPVTVKMRIGWDTEHIFAIENALAVQRAGGAAVSMHARTRDQLYRGKANWDILKEVKKELVIPLIGNGDVFTPEQAKKLLDHTECDGVMIGRGALGNPWMLYRTVHYLTKGELLPEPSIEEKIRIALLHMNRLANLRNDQIAVREMRKHLAWYLKGLPDSATLKNEIMDLQTRHEVESLLNLYVHQIAKNK